MRYITPITDRSAGDVVNGITKAFFNVADWNRIHNNSKVTKALVDFILSIDIPYSTVFSPTTVAVPTITELNTLLQNIENIRVTEGLPSISGLTEIKTNWDEGYGAESPSYIEVNQWESILDSIYNSIGKTLDYRVYCGVANAGQPRFWQARFHTYEWVPKEENPPRSFRVGVSVPGQPITFANGFRRYT